VAVCRPLMYGVSGACTLLLVGTVVLWARSNDTWDVFATFDPSDGRVTHWWSSTGRFTWEQYHVPRGREGELTSTHTRCYRAYAVDFFGGPMPKREVFPLEFAWSVQKNALLDGTTPLKYYETVVPHWFVALLLTPSVLWLSAAVRRTLIQTRRRRRGLCEACGYDLRASPERCPECGTPRAEDRRDATSAEVPAGSGP